MVAERIAKLDSRLSRFGALVRACLILGVACVFPLIGWFLVAPVLRGPILAHAHAWAWLVALGELSIGIALALGICVRLASAFGLAFMLALLFSSNYPGPGAPLWQYFGAALDHLVLALCFGAFLAGRADAAFRIKLPWPARSASRSDPAARG